MTTFSDALPVTWNCALVERNWSTRSDAVMPDGNQMNSGDMVYRRVGSVDCLEQAIAVVASTKIEHKTKMLRRSSSSSILDASKELWLDLM